MHQFLDFKSFEEASLDLSRPFTILIGKNGSGKSNAIEGVELLAQLAQGRLLSEITDIGRSSSGFQVRGGLTACVRTGKSTFSLRLGGSISVPIEPKQRPYHYQIVIQALPEPRIQSEQLEYDGGLVFGARAQNGKLVARASSTLSDTREFATSLLTDQSLFSRYHALPPEFLRQTPQDDMLKLVSQLRHAVVSGMIDLVRQEMLTPFVFDPQPRLMRAYERLGQRTLARDGANLSAVLYSLHQGTAEEQAALARILQRIRQLPEEPFEEFDFVVTSLNDVLFGIREFKGGPLIDARLLSDGTLRCIAVLAALETVEEGSRVIIEEFDNGLHPSRVNILTQAISEACERRQIKVLVTTHNPATLDGLTREQLEGVVLCVWDKARKSSRLVPLLELPRADVLLERGHLGDLVTRRVLEQHLMPGFEEEQKAKAQEWLDSLT